MFGWELWKTISLSCSHSCSAAGNQSCACAYTPYAYVINSLHGQELPSCTDERVVEVQAMDQPETRVLTALLATFHTKHFTIRCRSSPGGNFGAFWRLPQAVPAVPRPIFMFQSNLYILTCWLVPWMENLVSLRYYCKIDQNLHR